MMAAMRESLKAVREYTPTESLLQGDVSREVGVNKDGESFTFMISPGPTGERKPS